MGAPHPRALEDRLRARPARLRGNGPANDASPERSAAFVAGLADALGLGRAAVAGNSFGGLVALRLALSEPARVWAL